MGLDLRLVRFGPHPKSGSKPPADHVWIGNYAVENVPAFVFRLKAGTRAHVLNPENGRRVDVSAPCLSEPEWVYGGTLWRLEQGETIAEHLASELDYTDDNAVSRPANGGVPCRATNTHTHGLLVRPYHPSKPGAGPYGDYVLDVTMPVVPDPPPTGGCAADPNHSHGITTKPLDYKIKIPGHPGVNSIATGEHPSGLFWYHPHPHGYSRGQVAGGTTGLITVGSLSEYACSEASVAGGRCPRGRPEAQNMRYLNLKDAQIEQAGGGRWRMSMKQDPSLCGSDAASANGECANGDGTKRWVYTVNGVQFPEIRDVKAGEAEIWRIGNTSPNVTYRLVIVGPTGSQVPMQVLAIDGVSIPQAAGSSTGIYLTDEILMMPGTRAEVRIAPQPAGSYSLRTLQAVMGANDAGDKWPAVDLATVRWPAAPAVAAATQHAPAAAAATSPLRVEGPTLPAPAAPVPQAIIRRAQAPVPPGCVYGPGDTRRVYLVHRTVDGREVFGILAGIQRASGKLEFFDDKGDLAPEADLAAVWSTVTKDPFGPAFGHNQFGTICTVRGSSERWVVENWTSENHNFHVHQSRFRLDGEHFRDPAYFQFASGAHRAPDVAATDALFAALGSGSTGAGTSTWANALHDSIPAPRGESACADGANSPGCPQEGDPPSKECSGDPTDTGLCRRPGRVSLLIDFSRAEQMGDFVYHCHILEHEDGGMMARVRVLCRPGDRTCEGASASSH